MLYLLRINIIKKNAWSHNLLKTLNTASQLKPLDVPNPTCLPTKFISFKVILFKGTFFYKKKSFLGEDFTQ